MKKFRKWFYVHGVLSLKIRPHLTTQYDISSVVTLSTQ